MGWGLLGWGTTLASGVLDGLQQSHIAMIIQVVDARTSRLLFSTTVEGKANDFNIGGFLAGFAGGVAAAGGLGVWQKTPVEKAIRIAIVHAIQELSAKTPPTYFRHRDDGAPAATGPATAITSARSETTPASAVEAVRGPSPPVSAAGNIDPSLGRAARIHGASDTQAFLRVTLPLSVPGVVSGALIVFALAIRLPGPADPVRPGGPRSRPSRSRGRVPTRTQTHFSPMLKVWTSQASSPRP